MTTDWNPNTGDIPTSPPDWTQDGNGNVTLPMSHLTNLLGDQMWTQGLINNLTGMHQDPSWPNLGEEVIKKYGIKSPSAEDPAVKSAVGNFLNNPSFPRVRNRVSLYPGN